MDSVQTIIDDLKSTGITNESVAAFKQFLEKCSPEALTKIVVEELLPYLFKSDTKNRTEMLNLITNSSKIEVKYLNKADLSKFKLKCLQEFVYSIDKLQAADSTDWSILCISLFRILGIALHNDVEVINRVLKSIESGFRNKPTQKCEAYKCWMALIQNYNIVPSYLKQPKQMRLLIKPLKVPLSKQACVVEIRFDTFVLLLEAVGKHVMSNFMDFLQFVFNIRNVSACEATVIIPSYKNIWSKSTIVLFQSLGCEGNIEHICNYKTNIGTLVDVKYFKHNYKCLVYAARVCSELTYQWCSKPNLKQIVESLWISIFKLSHNSDSEKNVVLNILEHVNMLFQIVSSNDFVYDYILMPIVEIIYKNSELNSATFRSDLLIPFLKLYIEHTDLHVRSRNDAVAKLFSFSYSNNSLIDVYSLFDSLEYSEVLELVWFECNNIFVPELTHYIDHGVSKSNVLIYLKWPVENIKYLNMNECMQKLWKSTILIVHKTDPDIISQLFDSLKLTQQTNNWIIVNILIIGSALLEITTRKTSTMECLAVTINDCLENSAKGIEQFVLYKHAFFQCYVILLNHLSSNMTVFTSMLKSLDKFIQNLPDLIIKTIPHSFVQFMETSSRMANSIEAVNIITKLRPNTLYSTPTIFSRSKKMASLNCSVLLPNFSNKVNDNDSSETRSGLYKRSLSDKKKSITISTSTDISGFEHNLVSSPKSIRSSYLDKIKNKGSKSVIQGSVPIKSRTKSIMDFADNAFVQIDTVVSPDITRMSSHQRDALCRRRDDIPALYSDLSQSQSLNADSISADISNTQIELMQQNNTSERDLDPTQLLNSDTIVDQSQPESTYVESKATALLQNEELDIEITPRKKLFQDDSSTDSNAMDSNVFIDKQHLGKDLFNIGKDVNSKTPDHNEAISDLKLSTKKTHLKIVAGVNKTGVTDDFDTINSNSPNKVLYDSDKDSRKDTELTNRFDRTHEIKTRSKIGKSLTGQHCKNNKSRSLESKSKKNINLKNFKTCEIMNLESTTNFKFDSSGDKEKVDKLNVNIEKNDKPDATLNEVLNKFNKKNDLCNQNDSIQFSEVSIDINPEFRKIKAINNSILKKGSKATKRNKIKFVTKGKTYNNEPAKHITGDCDLYLFGELSDLDKTTIDHEVTHLDSELKNEVNSYKVNNISGKIPISTEINCRDLSASQNSTDIIEETESFIKTKVRLLEKEKLKNELKRLRMDIVGGDMATSVSSKRLRKEKFNLSASKKKIKRSRKRLSFRNDRCKKDKSVHNEKEDRESLRSATSKSTPENDIMKNNVEQNNTALITTVNIEQAPQINENSEKDTNTISDNVQDPKNIDEDIQIYESQLTFENNGQQLYSENEDQNQLLRAEKLTEVFGNLDRKEISSFVDSDSLKKDGLPKLTINATSEAAISKETFLDINLETPNVIKETETYKEPFMNISFIGSMDIQPHTLNNDVHTKDTLSIGINEIDTETCDSSCTPQIVEELKSHENNKPALIPSSPITNTTPSKNQILLTDTLDISPIGAGATAEKINKCNSPDLFESETLTTADKVLEDSSREIISCEENIIEDIVVASINSESKSNIFKHNIDVPKSNNNPMISHFAPLKLLNSCNVISSPKTHRIQKMMQNLEDKNSNNILDSKEYTSNYNKEDFLEFSSDLPKADARPRTPSILKRKLPDYIDEGVSPLSKRKRVNFSDPPTTSSKMYLKYDEESFMQRIFKSAGKFTVKPHNRNNQNDMNFNIKVNIKNNANSSGPEAHVENQFSDTTKLIRTESENYVGELSDLYPELMDCSENVEILHNLSDFIDNIKNKGIKTIADIVSLKISEIEELPFAEPKFKRINSALSLYCCKDKNNGIQTDNSIHKIITVDCPEKSISNVNIINNIILSPKHIEKDNSFGLAAVSQNIKSNILQLVEEGYSPDDIGEELNNILRSCNLPLSINLPYY